MASLEKKAGFLKGLIEGMEMDKETPKNKLLTAIVDLLSEVCERTEAMDEMLSELNEYVEDIDDDLARLEHDGDLDGDDEEDFNFFDDDDDDLPFTPEPPLRLLHEGDKHAPALAPAAEAEDGETALDGGICPECGGLAFIEGGDPEALYVCPHCHKKVHLKPLSAENTPIAKPAEED